MPFATSPSAPGCSVTTANGRCTPDQVAVLNEVYSPTQEQFDKAWDILDAYQRATEDERRGAVMFGDEMIDEASRKMAVKFVDARRARRARALSRLNRYRYSGRLLHQAPGDHLERERLVGTLEDRQHPGVDEEAANGELLGVAHSAVYLHRLAGDPLRCAADVRLHHRGFERAGVCLPSAARPRT